MQLKGDFICPEDSCGKPMNSKFLSELPIKARPKVEKILAYSENRTNPKARLCPIE